MCFLPAELRLSFRFIMLCNRVSVWNVEQNCELFATLARYSTLISLWTLLAYTIIKEASSYSLPLQIWNPRLDSIIPFSDFQIQN
jgi:hypothetical protein